MNPTNPKPLSAAFLALILPLFALLGTTVSGNAQVPDGYMSCAQEGERCMFDGATKEVLYGIGTKFLRKTATNFINCNVATFGSDPAPNVRKKCYIPYNPQTDNPEKQKFQQCGTEGQRCNFTGQRRVMYGAGEKWAIVVRTGGIDCHVSQFGDPAPNVHKKCFVSPDQTATGPRTFPETFKGAPLTLRPIDYNGMWYSVKPDGNPLPGANNIRVLLSGDTLTFQDYSRGDPSRGTVYGAQLTSNGIVERTQGHSATGTVSDNGKKITWSDGRIWVRQINVPATQLNYAGTWMLVNPDGTPVGKVGNRIINSVITLTQSGGRVTSSGGIADSTYQTSGADKLQRLNRDGSATSTIGTVSENGTKLTWSDGYVWIKQVRSGPPAKFPDDPIFKRIPDTGVFATFNATEMRCVNLVQNHVYADTNTQQTRWSDLSLNTLCKGSVVPVRTIECYIDATNSMGTGDKPVVSHNEALTRCSASAFKPPPVPMGVDPDVANVTPKAQTQSEAATLLNDSKPLNESDMNQVMRWIANEVASIRLPFCWRQARPRGAPLARAINDRCPAGHDVSIVGCSPPCPADFNGYRDAGTCYQTCRGNRPSECSLFGCARDDESCLSTLKDQFTAIGTLGFNIVAAAVGKAGGIAGKVEKYQKLQSLAEGLQDAVDKVQQFQTITTTVKAQIELFQTMAASNFDVITSPEIDAEIDKRFGRIGGYYVKKQYAVVHLGLTKDANFQATWKNVATLAGLADPTGLIDTWNAFFQPKCANDFPFPNVAILYKY